MSTHVPALLLAGLSLALSPERRPATAEPAKADKGKPAGPAPVEVRFANGSVVVMNLLQDHIEVQTDYGKLTVPYKDVRRIEFGVHPSEAERRQIEDAIRRLSSNVYRDREAAVRGLVALGPLCYFHLQRATRSADPETAKRATEALQKIRQKVPPRLLRTREEDVIRTVKFPVVGRIITPVIKAHAEDFGDLDLRPARLLAMRWLEGETEKQVVVDAARYGGQTAQWLDTGVRVGPEAGLKITATGQVDLWPQQPGQYMTGPDGQGGGGGRVRGPALVVAGGDRGGALMGRIGEDGTPFLIGSRYTRTPRTEGKLYLNIVASPWGNPSAGEYRVTITTGPFEDTGNREDE